MSVGSKIKTKVVGGQRVRRSGARWGWKGSRPVLIEHQSIKVTPVLILSTVRSH